MAQYVYILINPSLTGLLKIGRTNRSPEERAIELSKGTNMPTPFVVAYEEKVPDSKIAEKLVHDELAQQGFRVSDSREFFSIPLKIAIQVVSRVAQQLCESAPNTGECSSDLDEDNKYTGNYYLQKGINASNGSEDVLQDYGVARDCFEKAIALGNTQAHVLLAFLYLNGNGVRKSEESALKILKSGGEKGEPECFKTMWGIYSGRNGSGDLGHSSNSELCFKWYLDAVKQEVDTTALDDYLHLSYATLIGDEGDWEKKFPISQFPGRFVSIAIDIQIERMQKYFFQIRNFRLAGELLENFNLMGESSDFFIFELAMLEIFLSSSVQDGNDIMRRAMAGVGTEDLNYIFSGSNNFEKLVESYIKYISTPSYLVEKKVLKELEPNICEPATVKDPIIIKKSSGFFGRLLSGRRSS